MIDKSDNKEPDIIDSEQIPDKPAKPPKAIGAGFALFIAFIALFFTAAGIAAGYKHWQRMSDRAKSNAHNITVLEEIISKTDNQAVDARLEELNRNYAAQQGEIAEQMAKMRQMHRQTEQFSDNVASQVRQITTLQANAQNEAPPSDPEDWKLAEVGFLLKLANRELRLSMNKAAAEAALREADQILSEMGSAAHLPVREQIAGELAALDAVTMPDLAVLSEQISTLEHTMEPVLTGLSVTDTGSEQSDAVSVPDIARTTGTEPEKMMDKTASTWQGYKQKAAKILNDAVVIRKLDHHLPTEFDFDAREQAYQLLRLRLEALRLMALRQQDDAYQQQLALIRNTVNAYYPEQQAAEISRELDQLAAIQLRPVLPDISGSLRQLEKVSIAGVEQ